MKKKVKQNNGILVTEKKMRIQKESGLFWVLNYLLDCFLIWMCLYGALFGFCHTMKITKYLEITPAVFGLVILLVRFLCDKRWKNKYVFLLFLALYGVVLFLYHEELYYGLMYWADYFFVGYNSYFGQNLAVSTDYIGMEAYSSTVLLLFSGSVMAVFLSEGQRMTKAELTVLILPFCLFILPFVVGKVPDAKYVLFFLGGMIPLAFSVESRSPRMKFQIKMAGAFSFLAITLLCVWLFPERLYNERYQKLQETKTFIQDSFKNQQYDDLIYYFGDFDWLPFVGSGSGGVNNGTLGNKDEIVYDNKTDFDLYVQDLESSDEDTTLIFNSDLYLRSYVGINYKNKQWMDMTEMQKKKYDKLVRKNDLNVEKLPEELYSIFYGLFDVGNEGRKQVGMHYKIIKRRVTRNHALISYGSRGNLYLKDQLFQTPEIKHKKNFWDEANILYFMPESLAGENSIWSSALSSIVGILKSEQEGLYGEGYQRAISEFKKTEQQYRTFVYQTYTDVPKNIAPKLRTEVEKSDKLNDYESCELLDNNYMKDLYDLMSQCQQQFGDTKYSLKPGKTPDGKDLIDYFIYENKKGYCTYYATAACIFFRLCGIPSRYVEGYHVHNYDFTSMESRTITGEDGNETKEKYYPVDVKDSNAHAWIEIYVNGYGWVPLDYTASSLSGSSIIDENEEKNPDVENKNPDMEDEPVVPSPSISPTPSPSVSENTPLASEDVPGIGNASVKEFRLSRTVKAVLMVIFIFLLIAAAVYIRYQILWNRQNHLRNNNNLNVRAKYYYNKIKKQLYTKCGIGNQQELKENVAHICRKENIILEEDLKRLVSIVEKASFGSGQISDYECTKVKILAENVDKLFYESMPHWKKFYYKVWKLY